jgi:hypothetical protein
MYFMMQSETRATMNEFRKALDDIGNIRLHLAAGTMFRGFGPAVIAATGIMALATATIQFLMFSQPNDAITFVAIWAALAIISAALIGFEMIARTKRHHGGLADAMLFNAVEHFLPIGAAGVVVCAIVLRFAPEVAWLLPGLWEILIGVGLFVAMRFLPRSISIAAAWYFVAGATALIVSCQSRTLSPWAMGIPFGIGQLLMAGLLHGALGGDDGKA